MRNNYYLKRQSMIPWIKRYIASRYYILDMNMTKLILKNLYKFFYIFTPQTKKNTTKVWNEKNSNLYICRYQSITTAYLNINLSMQWHIYLLNILPFRWTYYDIFYSRSNIMVTVLYSYARIYISYLSPLL